MNKGEEQVEGSVHHTREVVWADSDDLWIDKSTSDFSDHDEWNPTESY